LSLVPLRFGCGGATGYQTVVTAHDDGSVELQTSGCEIGQALNTKVAQTAAFVLGVDMEKITVGCVTSKVATSVMDFTGASTTSEACCASTKLACEALKAKMAISEARLQGELGREPTFEELVARHLRAGGDNTASGIYDGKKPEPGLPGPSKMGGKQYMSYGAAYVGVEVDLLTGEVSLERADVLLDCGTSLNPDIDAGQVQGAFVMGLGYYLSEEFVWDEATGANLSNGTWEYKPPCSRDIPVEFNVALLSNAPNPAGILSSKASGEPSITASCAALFAVQHAISAAREDEGNADPVSLSAPATGEAITAAAMLAPSNFTLS